MLSSQSHYYLRLPGYRSSYGRRYHPYATMKRPCLQRAQENILRGIVEALAMPPAAVLRPVRSAEDGSDDDVPSFSLDTSASNELEIKRRPDEPMFNLLLPFKVSAFGACVAFVVERMSQTARTVLHWLKRSVNVLSR